MAAGDNCDNCQQDYAFSKERDNIHIYPHSPRHNHVTAKCPHCGAVTTIFLDAAGLSLTASAGVPVHFYDAVHDVVADEREQLDERLAQFSKEPELPGAPRDWLIQLYDDMRHFDHNCDGSCGYA